MEAEPLAAACELAFAVAREGKKAVPPVDPPDAMLPFLYLPQLPRRAMTVAQRAIEEDPTFRRRVAAEATEQGVGRAGYLWLTRPQEWDSEVASEAKSEEQPKPSAPGANIRPPKPPAPTPDKRQFPAPPLPIPERTAASKGEFASATSIEEELANLRGLVDQLSLERKTIASSADLPDVSPEDLADSSAPEQATASVPDSPLESPKEGSSADSEALAGLEAEILALQEELESAKERSSELEAELAKVQEQTTSEDIEVISLAQEDALRQAKDAHAIELQELLGAAAAQSEQHAAEIDSALKEAKAVHENELAELRQDNEADLLAATSAHEDALAELRQAHENAMTELRQSHEADLAELAERHAEEIQAGQENVDAVAAQLAEATTTRETIERSLSESQDEASRLLAERDQLLTEKEELEGTLRIADQARIDLELELERMSTQWQAMQVELETARTALQGTRSAFEESSISVGQRIAEVEGILAQSTWTDPAKPEDAAPEDAAPEDAAAEDAEVESLELSSLLDSYGLGASGEPDVDTGDAESEPGDDTDNLAEESTAEDSAPAPVEAYEQRVRIEVPAEFDGNSLATIRFVVESDDVVVLVDGDAVAEMGWPDTTVAVRREALVKYLGDLAADTGAAQDTVFSGSLSDGDELPVSRAVRVRITAEGVEPTAALAELVDSYPKEWPVAVVSDDPTLGQFAHSQGATVLTNGQLLDLLFDRWEASQQD